MCYGGLFDAPVWLERTSPYAASGYLRARAEGRSAPRVMPGGGERIRAPDGPSLPSLAPRYSPPSTAT